MFHLRINGVEENHTVRDTELSEKKYIYISTAVACMIAYAVAMIFSNLAKTTAARRLHDTMFSCVMTAKMQFFESNNTGD